METTRGSSDKNHEVHVTMGINGCVCNDCDEAGVETVHNIHHFGGFDNGFMHI